MTSFSSTPDEETVVQEEVGEVGAVPPQQTFVIAGQTISFGRGSWVYADMNYKGANFRFANTHLEVVASRRPSRTVAGQAVREGGQEGRGHGDRDRDFNTDAYGQYFAEELQDSDPLLGLPGHCGKAEAGRTGSELLPER